jgi:hypothetical protein
MAQKGGEPPFPIRVGVAVYENGEARLRRLDIEADDGAQVAVRAGLNASDQLILNPPIGLVDGMRVATASEARLPGGGRADHGLVE